MYQEFDLPLDVVRNILTNIPCDDMLCDAFAGYTNFDGSLDHCRVVTVDGKSCIRISVPMRKTRDGWVPTQISGEIEDVLNIYGAPIVK